MRTFVLGLLALAATNPSRAGAVDKAEGPAAPGETKRVRWPARRRPVGAPIASGA